MEQLIINAINETPEINFDGDKGIFSISGKSYPEDVNSFYKPVFDYIDLYKKNPQGKTTIEFKWIYFNTATSKIIVSIIMSMKEWSKEFEVKWICDKDKELLIDKGLELQDILDVNFKIVYK